MSNFPFYKYTPLPPISYLSLIQGRGSGRLEKVREAISQNPTALKAATAIEWKSFSHLFWLWKKDGRPLGRNPKRGI
ncbi:hypothetical protein DW687_01590 [Anaerofustis stercorihominis]|uniref:Uncharacterized protein n=1 Tax=Anaerofustis stercorihominis TaxID=214853 RepID=A0A3E3E0G4_9FIRM|nr:hypothetical protein DW687_01590 [Anaerofustis stercorihominis]